MNPEQIREDIIRPALKAISLWSPEAEILIYGTGMVESNYENLKQIHGPALSYWQIEPNTHSGVRKYLSVRTNRDLFDRVTSCCFMSVLPDDEALIYNMRYAVIICRMIYYTYSAPIPDTNNAKDFAEYHKKYYNTAKGKADVGRNTEVFEKILNRG
jgi:hypothetical protein